MNEWINGSWKLCDLALADCNPQQCLESFQSTFPLNSGTDQLACSMSCFFLSQLPFSFLVLHSVGLKIEVISIAWMLCSFLNSLMSFECCLTYSATWDGEFWEKMEFIVCKSTKIRLFYEVGRNSCQRRGKNEMLNCSEMRSQWGRDRVEGIERLNINGSICVPRLTLRLTFGHEEIRI